MIAESLLRAGTSHILFEHRDRRGRYERAPELKSDGEARSAKITVNICLKA